MDIRVDENIPLGPGVFGPHGKVTAFAGRSLRRADLAGADALIVRSVTRVDADLLEGTPVKFVGTATIGTDHVDQAYLASRGIGFASAPGCNANSVGDYVVAALLRLLARGRAGRQARPAAQGTPEGPGETGFEGLNLGVVGYGNVGKRVAAKAEALGMTVVRCDPPLAAAGAPGEFLPLPALLERSDVVSLHVPLMTSGPHPTRRLADAAFFARLTRPIVFLNTCRGEVVSEPDLRAARESGRIRGLVLDVFAGEPRIDPVLAGEADLVTPHIAGYSVEGKVGGTFQVAEAFRRHFGLAAPALPPRPAPADPVLRWPAAAAPSDAAFLSDCVRAAYDIEADDARLRAALRESDPGAGFDRLRKEYPVRHEHLAYRVEGVPPERSALRARLRGLGFAVA